jgi:hypothetical protein
MEATITWHTAITDPPKSGEYIVTAIHPEYGIEVTSAIYRHGAKCWALKQVIGEVIAWAELPKPYVKINEAKPQAFA